MRGNSYRQKHNRNGMTKENVLGYRARYWRKLSTWIRDAEDKKAKNAIVKNLKLIYFKLIDLNLQPLLIYNWELDYHPLSWKWARAPCPNGGNRVLEGCRRLIMTKKEIGYVIPSLKGRRHEVPRGTERQIQNKANFLSISSLLSSIWQTSMPRGWKIWTLPGWGGEFEPEFSSLFSGIQVVYL